MIFNAFPGLAMALAITLAAVCPPAGAESAVRPYVLEGTEVHHIPSKILPRYAEIICIAHDPGDAAVNYYLLKLMGFPDVKVMTS